MGQVKIITSEPYTAIARIGDNSDDGPPGIAVGESDAATNGLLTSRAESLCKTATDDDALF